MGVGSPRHDGVAALHQGLRQRLRVLHHLPRVPLELGGHGLAQRHGLRGDHVLERSTLQPREHLLVHVLREPLLAQDQTAPRAPQRLVGGGRDDLRVRHGRGMDSRGHETRDVGHVHDEDGAHLVGDAPERREVDHPGVGGRATDQEARALAPGDLTHQVVVDPAGLFPHPVMRRPE